MLGEINTTLTQIQSSLVLLRMRDEQQDAFLTAIQTADSDFTVNLNMIRANITTLMNNLSGLTSQVASNSTAINTNATDIQTQKTRIDNLTTQLNGVKTNVDSLILAYPVTRANSFVRLDSNMTPTLLPKNSFTPINVSSALSSQLTFKNVTGGIAALTTGLYRFNIEFSCVITSASGTFNSTATAIFIVQHNSVNVGSGFVKLAGVDYSGQFKSTVSGEFEISDITKPVGFLGLGPLTSPDINCTIFGTFRKVMNLV